MTITSKSIPIVPANFPAPFPNDWPVHNAQPRIDLEELDDCLRTFYYGDLNWVPDNCLTHLSGDAWELIPGRPLESIMDHDSMAIALALIPAQAAYTIAAYWAGGAVSSGAYGAALATLGHIIIATM